MGLVQETIQSPEFVVDLGENIFGPEVRGLPHQIARAGKFRTQRHFSFVKTGRLLKFRIQNGQLLHVIVRGHLPEQIRGAEREADDFFHLALERNERQVRVHAGATNHVLRRADFLQRNSLLFEELLGKLDAPGHVRERVFGAGAAGVVLLLQVAGVVQ